MYQIYFCALFSDKLVLSFVCIKTMPRTKKKKNFMIQLILYSLWEEEKTGWDEDYAFTNKGNSQGPGNS